MVVAFDSLNKFIRDVPGKITKTDQIYSSLAQWENIGEIDFRDCYHHVRMANFTEEDHRKQGYLCVRTAQGTLVCDRGTQGLLGIDCFQDELTVTLYTKNDFFVN